MKIVVALWVTAFMVTFGTSFGSESVPWRERLRWSVIASCAMTGAAVLVVGVWWWADLT